MGIRETLEKNRTAVIVLVALLIVICLGVIYWEAQGPRQAVVLLAGKVFYSDDDGQSWFFDDSSKGSPFDHHGKQAYRALVFRCPGGGPFVAFLAKYSDQQKAQDAADLTHAPPGTPSRLLGMVPQDLKKPGDSKWETVARPSETGYPQVKCPDGQVATLVQPTDPVTGIPH
jgi:hypothetical protein